MKSRWILWTALVATSFSSPLWALDKVWLEYHLRASLANSVPGIETLQIIVGDPGPSEFGNLLKVPVTIGTATQYVYLSADEKQYIWGNVYDLTIDPDKSRLDRINFTDVHYKGSPKAPVKVVEFTDLECPYCSNAHAALEAELYKNYSKDQVQWVYKHFPLNMHKWAEPAAVAAECAGEQKKDAFWDMAHEFFTNAGALNQSVQMAEQTAGASQDPMKDKAAVSGVVKKFAMDAAKRLKLNPSKFEACVDSGATLQKVKADQQEGFNLGVNSTPTIFVNGRMKKGFRDFSGLKTVIDEKLNNKSANAAGPTATPPVTR